MRLPIDGSLSNASCSESLSTTLRSASTDQRPIGHGHWRATYRTLRIAGTTYNLWLSSSWHAQHWLADDPRDIPELKSFRSFEPSPISLVILAREGDPAVPDLIDRYRSVFADIVIVLDSYKECNPSEGSIRFIGRPLDSNFAAQRNAGTCAAEAAWVLHLDTDEEVSDDFCAVLPHLASAAQMSGYLAVGFPRRNYVDNRLSDLFPDIQYRLIRRDVLFEGRVHERPSVCGQGDRTIVSQHGMIDHWMARDRVRARSERYDQMGQEAARHQDDVALLSAFAP